MPQRGVSERRANYDDLLKVPEHLVAELLDGELHTSPRPSPRHANAATSLGALVVGPFQHGRGGPGSWVILAEPELHLEPDVGPRSGGLAPGGHVPLAGDRLHCAATRLGLRNHLRIDGVD